MWKPKKEKKEEKKVEEAYEFKNSRIGLLEESRRDSEKAMLNCDVNLKQLNKMLLSPMRQGTTEIAQGLAQFEKQKKNLAEGIKVINDMIQEIYDEDNKAGKEV